MVVAVNFKIPTLSERTTEFSIGVRSFFVCLRAAYIVVCRGPPFSSPHAKAEKERGKQDLEKYFWVFLKKVTKTALPKRDRSERGNKPLLTVGKGVKNTWSYHHPKRKPSGINLTAFAERYCGRNAATISEK